MKTPRLAMVDTFSDGMPKSVKITYRKAEQKLEVRSLGLFKQKFSDFTVVSIKEIEDTEYDDIREIAKRCKGIIITSDTKGIRILNDPFCTVPLYYTETPTHFISSSDPQVLIDYPRHPFDAVGVWETLLLNSPLWNRTSYRSVKFLPAACELYVSKEVKLQRYWNLVLANQP